MFSVHYCVFPSLPHPRSERPQQQQQPAQKMRHAKRSIIRHMPIYPACMPIYLTGGEGHDLFNRYEPQILRTVYGAFIRAGSPTRPYRPGGAPSRTWVEVEKVFCPALGVEPRPSAWITLRWYWLSLARAASGWTILI
jgi:hypothetical protein